MLIKTQYRKLLNFAFIPHNILRAVKIRDNAVGDHLLAYLCFAFERTREENMVVEESRILFAPGLKNTLGMDLYCCFGINRNQKQPWALTRIDTWQNLRWPFRGMKRPIPMSALADFNRSLHSFAFLPRRKLEAIAPSFGGDVGRAALYTASVFEWANKYGYIAYQDDRALFHTGLFDGQAGIYALFTKNPQSAPCAWILVAFVSEMAAMGAGDLPPFVLGDNPMAPWKRETDGPTPPVEIAE